MSSVPSTSRRPPTIISITPLRALPPSPHNLSSLPASRRSSLPFHPVAPLYPPILSFLRSTLPSRLSSSPLPSRRSSSLPSYPVVLPFSPPIPSFPLSPLLSRQPPCPQSLLFAVNQSTGIHHVRGLHPESPAFRIAIVPLPVHQANGASCNESAAAAAMTEDTEKFSFPKAPVFMKAPVVTGFGRGSKQMGIPTANMLPEVLREQLEGMQRGVYFGWARLPHLEGEGTTHRGAGGEGEVGGGEEGTGRPRVFKMVLNVGRRPTFVDGDDVTVVRDDVTVILLLYILPIVALQEVHILSSFEDDFYGEELQVVVLGYIRPERKFSSLDDLVSQIKSDIAVATEQLDTAVFAPYARDLVFA
ncbi:unnamed protein product [Closterium sp. NIES-65]|nr:unnamed protein product [Closterium sp. NIES-65]